MNVGLEITYREVEKTDAIDNLVHEKVAKLEKFCNYLNSCHIAIEKIHDRPRSGSPYRVRIDLTVPPNHELVAESNPGEDIYFHRNSNSRVGNAHPTPIDSVVTSRVA